MYFEKFTSCIFLTIQGNYNSHYFIFFVFLGVVVCWSSPSPSVREVRVRFPPGATIHLASECTLTRVNPYHVRGIGHHHSNTRVWGDMLDIVCGVVMMLRGSVLARAFGSPVQFEHHCQYSTALLCREHRVNNVR